MNNVLVASLVVLLVAANLPAQTPQPDLAQQLAQCRQTIAQQQQTIERLEAKVGLPSTLVGWVWFSIGFGGQFIFFLRFVVQWIASERAKKTVVPMAFWYLSLGGTVLVLSYAIQRIDPVFILAYGLNIFLYVRNLVIAKRQPAAAVLLEKESE